jgi:hypothetical protein
MLDHACTSDKASTLAFVVPSQKLFWFGRRQITKAIEATASRGKRSDPGTVSPHIACAHAGYKFIDPLRADLLPAQAQLHAAACDKTTRRANHLNPVQPFAQKYSA